MLEKHKIKSLISSRDQFLILALLSYLVLFQSCRGLEKMERSILF